MSDHERPRGSRTVATAPPPNNCRPAIGGRSFGASTENQKMKKTRHIVRGLAFRTVPSTARHSGRRPQPETAIFALRKWRDIRDR